MSEPYKGLNAALARNSGPSAEDVEVWPHRCKNCGNAVGSAWAKSDEFAASGYCGMCLNGPAEQTGGA